jgi:hypothetical protein
MPEPQFVRVRDRSTGDEYDVLETSVRDTDHELVKSEEYPPAPYPRPPKQRTDKAGNPAPKPTPAKES